MVPLSEQGFVLLGQSKHDKAVHVCISGLRKLHESLQVVGHVQVRSLALCPFLQDREVLLAILMADVCEDEGVWNAVVVVLASHWRQSAVLYIVHQRDAFFDD